MTSNERHQRRYERRQAKRQANKQKIAITCDNFEQVFTLRNIFKASKCCYRNVGWKASTQVYKANAIYNNYLTYKRLHNGTFKSDGFFEFLLNERGKIRQIKSVTIRERIVQRCLCDFSITPMLQRTLIYDNGASTRGKGQSFTVNRLVDRLRHFYHINQTNKGYILLYDFSKFFDSIDHYLIKQTLHKEYNNEKLKKLMFHFIDMFGDIGLGLGSQISQNLALVSANRLDHYVKEVLSIRGYARYMDDGYLLHKDKEVLVKCLEAIKNICVELKIKLNTKKTQIMRIDKGFSYLKIRFFVTSSGKIVKKIYPKNVTRMRRKLKKYKPKVDAGKMSVFDVYQSLQSWESHAKKLNAYRTRQNMRKLFIELYGGEKCSIKSLKAIP